MFPAKNPLMTKSSAFLALVLSTAWAVASPQVSTWDIHGPDTMILLGQRLAQLYRQQQPAVEIRIHGGGTAAALASVLQGSADIAQGHGSADAVPKGLISVPVGVEAIVVYVNEANPVSQLSLEQLQAIYLGKINNWKQVGGRDARILLYSGESSTNVVAFFSQAVLHNEESIGFEGKSSTKDLLQVIAEKPNAIGFASMGSGPKVKALRISARAGGPAVAPTFESIRKTAYPISRYIYWFFAKKPAGAERQFCEWVFSSRGQLVVESVGFQPLDVLDRQRALRALGIEGPVAGQ
jgi:phosphate transport system substrate-binding protein